MSEKVIQITEGLESVQRLKEIISGIEKNEIEALIIATLEPTRDDPSGIVTYYYFGKMLELLGLADRLKFKIHTWAEND